MPSPESSETKGVGAVNQNKTLQAVRLFIICLTFFIDIANLGMCTIALPTIKEQLGYDEGSLQWVMTAYALTYGGFLMIGGRLGDIFGQEHTLKLSMLAFNVFTLVCALVSSKVGFLISRALQGIAAAFTIPSAQAMIGHIFPDPKAHSLALSWWGASGSMGFVLGPIIGGLFTSLVSWRWIFWFPLIVEGFLNGLAFLLFRDASPASKNSLTIVEVVERLNPVGTSLSVSGLILLIYALTSGNEAGWSNGAVIGTLVAAIVLLVSFIFFETKMSRFPFVPRHMRKSSELLTGCVSAAMTYAVWQGANYFLTLQLQDLGYSALETSVRFLPLGVTAFLVNMVIPHLLVPIGPKVLMPISWLFAIAGVILFSLINSATDYWRLCFPGMILYIMGVGTVYYVSMVIVVTSAPAADQGSVAGVYNMALNVGGAVLGVAVLTVISNSITSNYGGQESLDARIQGYRASYYGAIGWSGLAILIAAYVLISDWKTRRSVASSAEAESSDQGLPVKNPPKS